MILKNKLCGSASSARQGLSDPTQKQYLNSLFPPKLSKEAHKKMSFIETNLEHWPFRRHCLHFTSRSSLGRNRQWLK